MTTKVITITLLMNLMCVSAQGENTLHNWTNIDGKTIEAKFVSMLADAVAIKKQGKIFTIPFINLTPESVELAKRLNKTTTSDRATTTQVTNISSDLEHMRAYDQGVDEQKLWELVRHITDKKTTPIFSLLISRRGKLIFELYTGGIDPDASHYLMSVTKSMLSTLVGIAIDKGAISNETKPLSEILPATIFKKNQAEKFSVVNLKDVMGMSALDAPVPPHDNSSRANTRGLNFFSSKNRLDFALSEDLLKSIGIAYQYNDITPTLASGALSYCTGKSAFEFAVDNLFEPLGFKNAEWMHQDGSGLDMGGYGLRLRPIDMQKWGVLFLNKGRLGGKQLISEDWISKSAEPYIASSSRNSNYGWFWWRQNYETPLVFQEANGWKGQRLAINYDKQIVISMTACIEDNDENVVFGEIMRDYIIPSIDPPPGPRKNEALENDLVKLRKSRPRYSSSMEARMIPSIEPKEKRTRFTP
jgi:CubicO group peptidase (beta-lactamase class C family)